MLQLPRSGWLPRADVLKSSATTTPFRPARVICCFAAQEPDVASRVLAAVAAVSVASTSLFAGSSSAFAALPGPSSQAMVEQQYEQQVHRLHHPNQPMSNLPSSNEAEALQQLVDRDMFTPEAWEGMLRLQQYAQYVEQLSASGVEEAPGCESCAANRMMLEKVGRGVQQHNGYACCRHNAYKTCPAGQLPVQVASFECTSCLYTHVQCWMAWCRSILYTAAVAPTPTHVVLCCAVLCLRPGRPLQWSFTTQPATSARRSGPLSCWQSSRRMEGPSTPALTPTRP